MTKPDVMPECCGEKSVWVDNIPSKAYAYCRQCKNEVSLSAGRLLQFDAYEISDEHYAMVQGAINAASSVTQPSTQSIFAGQPMTYSNGAPIPWGVVPRSSQPTTQTTWHTTPVTLRPYANNVRIDCLSCGGSHFASDLAHIPAACTWPSCVQAQQASPTPCSHPTDHKDYDTLIRAFLCGCTIEDHLAQNSTSFRIVTTHYCGDYLKLVTKAYLYPPPHAAQNVCFLECDCCDATFDLP